MRRETWEITDHVCRKCGGRILKAASDCGASGGGNPLFRCADCGNSCSGMGPEIVCWCGFSHRGQTDNPYVCVPFSVLAEQPELQVAFALSGYDTKNGEVGVLLRKDYCKRNVR